MKKPQGLVVLYLSRLLTLPLEFLFILSTDGLATTATTSKGNNDIHTKRKILVTGGTGYIGKHVVEHLIKRGDEVVIIDEISNIQEQSKAKSIVYYGGSIQNKSFLQEVFEIERPSQICHTDGIIDEIESINNNPFPSIEVNIQGTVNLLSLAVQYNITQYKFVLASSSAVYGDEATTSSVLSETNQADHPLSMYAATKKAGELFGHTWHYLYNLPFTSLRLFDDRTNIDDTVQAIVAALDHHSNTYDIFNIASDTARNNTPVVNITAAQTILGFQPHKLSEQGQSNEGEAYSPTDGYIKDNIIMSKNEIPVHTDSNNMMAAVHPSEQKHRRRLHEATLDAINIALWDDTTDYFNADLPFVKASHGANDYLTRRKIHRRRLNEAIQRIHHKYDHSDWDSIPIVKPHTGYKTVLVTGAAGFVGSHVADKLLERGDNVIVVDEVNDYYNVTIKYGNLKYLQDKYSNTGKLKVYLGDVANETLMTHIFENDRPDWICHMAARAGVRPSILNPDVYIHSNIRGTVQLLEMAKRYPVQNFLFASSSSVYGGSLSTYFSEMETVDFPISPYAASKKTCEIISWMYHHLYNIPVTALRFFTVYGPRGRPDMAPFQFIDKISRGKTISQYGDGHSSRDYTYVDDIVNGVIRALDRPYTYQIFNLGKGSGTSLLDFIKFVQVYTGRQASIQVLPDQPGDVPYTCADVSKARHFLDYEPSVSFEEGIKRTIRWYNETYLNINSSEETITLETSNSISWLSNQMLVAPSSVGSLGANEYSSKDNPPKRKESAVGASSSVDLFYVQWFVLMGFLVVRLLWKFFVTFRKAGTTMNDLTTTSVPKKRTNSDIEFLFDESCQQ